MNCKDFTAYLDANPRADLSRDYRAHAGSCASCAEDLETRLSLRDAFAGWSEVEPPQDLASRALQRCVHEAPVRRAFPRFGILGLAGATAVLVAVIVRPVTPPTPVERASGVANSEDQRDVLAALGKAASHVAMAKEDTFNSLQKAIDAAERQGE